MRELETKRAGLLRDGDEFRLPATEPGQVFTYRGHFLEGDRGGAVKQPYVNAYGGDANPKARRKWRSFPTAEVVRDARPPGKLATAKQDRKESK